MKPTISTICTLLTGLGISIFSSSSLVIDLTQTQNITGIGVDLLFLFLGLMVTWNAISSHLEAKIARKQMEQEWEYKVQPLTNLITDAVGRINKLETDVMNTNLKVNTTLDYVMKAQDMDASKVYILPGASFKFVCKVMAMIIITSYSLFFTTTYPLGIIHYSILIIYLAWWGLFTSEYKLFQNTTSWVWGIAPIMIVPTMGIILDSTLGLNYMILILYTGLTIYAYSYYTWTCFTATGYKLIDIEPLIYILKEKLNKQKQMKKEELNEMIK